MKISKDIADYSLHAFVTRVLEAAAQGWTIDEWNPPQQLGAMFVTNMLRDEEVIDPPAPMPRAEVMAKARAAKKAKATAEPEKPADEAPKEDGPEEVPEDAPKDDSANEPEALKEAPAEADKIADDSAA